MLIHHLGERAGWPAPGALAPALARLAGISSAGAWISVLPLTLPAETVALAQGCRGVRVGPPGYTDVLAVIARNELCGSASARSKSNYDRIVAKSLSEDRHPDSAGALQRQPRPSTASPAETHTARSPSPIAGRMIAQAVRCGHMAGEESRDWLAQTNSCILALSRATAPVVCLALALLYWLY
jgi:hypothetical protein